jgi:hypothetical protein
LRRPRPKGYAIGFTAKGVGEATRFAGQLERDLAGLSLAMFDVDDYVLHG